MNDSEFRFDAERGKIVEFVPQEVPEDEDRRPQLEQALLEADAAVADVQQRRAGAEKIFQELDSQAEAASLTLDEVRKEEETVLAAQAKSRSRLTSWDQAVQGTENLASDDELDETGELDEDEPDEQAVPVRVATGFEDDDDEEDEDE